MKIRYRVGVILLLIAGSITLQAGNWHDKVSTKVVSKMIPPYFSMQEALADDDLEKAKEGAKSFLGAMKGAPSPRESTLMRKINDYASRVRRAKDIERARRGLAMLTPEVLGLIQKHADELNINVYQAHCPMAFDGEGASWLQKDKEIRNPYYGSSMLGCGKIRRSVVRVDVE